jgi:hypothetical protein
VAGRRCETFLMPPRHGRRLWLSSQRRKRRPVVPSYSSDILRSPASPFGSVR